MKNYESADHIPDFWLTRLETIYVLFISLSVQFEYLDFSWIEGLDIFDLGLIFMAFWNFIFWCSWE